VSNHDYILVILANNGVFASYRGDRQAGMKDKIHNGECNAMDTYKVSMLVSQHGKE
jgi:hypothetical protein